MKRLDNNYDVDLRKKVIVEMTLEDIAIIVSALDLEVRYHSSNSELNEKMRYLIDELKDNF